MGVENYVQYQEGYKAASEGESLEDCPHEHPQAIDIWTQGFKAFKKPEFLNTTPPPLKTPFVAQTTRVPETTVPTSGNK